MKPIRSAFILAFFVSVLCALGGATAWAQPTITTPENLSTLLNGNTTGTDNSTFTFRAIVVPSNNQVLVNLPGMSTPVAAYIDPFDNANPEAGAALRVPMAPDPTRANGWIAFAVGSSLNGGSGGKPPFGPGRTRHRWSIVARDSGTGGTFMNGINANPKPGADFFVVAVQCIELMPVDENFLPDKRLIPGQLGNGLRVDPVDPTAANDGSGAHIYTWRVRYRSLLTSGSPPAPSYDRSYHLWRDTRTPFDGADGRFNGVANGVMITGPVVLNLIAPDGTTYKCPMEFDPTVAGNPTFAQTYTTVPGNNFMVQINGGDVWNTGVYFRFRMVPTQYIWNHGPLRGEGPHTAFGGPTLPDSLPAIPIGLGGGADGEYNPPTEIIGRPFANEYVSFAGHDLLNFYPLGPLPPPFPFYTSVAGRAGQWRYYYETTNDLRPPTRGGFLPNYQYTRDLWGQDPGAYFYVYDSDAGPNLSDPSTPYGHPFVSPILSDGGWTDDIPANGYVSANGPSHRSRPSTKTIVRFICRVTKDSQVPLPANAVRVYIDGVAHTMEPLDSTDYTLGKPFFFDTQFIPGQEGQHNIYFEVDDGIHRTIWPRRDFQDGRPDLQGGLLPALGNPVTFGTGTIGRNYLNEPLVNNRPVLSNPLVTPPSGAASSQFTYTVTYQDANNDEPLDAFVYIDGFDDAHAHRMSPVTAAPTSQGRGYTFTMTSLVPTPDQKHFYFFKFRDNWNNFAQYNISPIRREFGEWVNLPQGDDNGIPSTVISGPIITGNNPPELYDTDVFASDPAHTPATLFDIVVKYRDPDNDAPTNIKVFLSADGGSTYDGGTTLAKAEASNNYASGVQYHLPARIQLPVGSNYRYKFQTSDGPNVTNLIHVGTGATAIQTGTDRVLQAVTGLPGAYEDPKFSRNWANISGTLFVWQGAGAAPNLLVEGLEYTVDYVNGQVMITGGNPGNLPIRASFFHLEHLMPNIVPNTAPTLTYPSPTSPPVYGALDKQQGQASDSYTYEIIYTDADNQAPAYVNLVIDTNKTVAMIQDPNTPQPVDYRRGIVYRVTVNGGSPELGVGNHTFHFETSDNADVVRKPLVTDTPKDLPGPAIADIGGLSTPLIQPFPKGKSNDQYLFTITYKSALGLAPAFPIELRVGATTGTAITKFELSPIDPVGPAQYMAGVRYQMALQGVAVATATEPLNPGTHDISFGFQGQPDSTTPQKLIVNGRPQLLNVLDTPDPVTQSGDIDIRVTYKDINGDAPQRAGIVLTMDGAAFTAVSPTTTPANPTAADYIAGVVYQWRIAGNSLALGSHTYSISAQDDLEDWDTAPTQPGGTFTVNAAARLVLSAPGPVDATTNDGTITPKTGAIGGQYTYRIVYKHPDLVPPQRIEVVIDPGTAAQSVQAMTSVNPAPASGDAAWGTGVTYQYITQPGQLPAGTHTYRFQAADRIPPDVLFPSTGSLTGPIVNGPPSLTEGIVFQEGGTPGAISAQNVLNPTLSGTTSTKWVFRVKYQDGDNVAPGTLGFVKVKIDNALEVALTPAAGDPLNYATGVVYESAPMTLSAGQKTFHFEANDGLDPARFPAGTAEITGLTIRNILVLEAPAGGTITPTSGPVSTQFTYQVVYKNADNTPPSYVRVIIDDGTPGRVERTMTKSTAGNNYAAGVTYQYVHRFAITETNPSHTYRFEAQDTLSPVVIPLPATGNFTGPNLNIAKFENVVFNPNPGTIGSAITVTGKLNVGGPITTTLSVQLVSPDGAGTNSSVTTNPDGTFSFNNFVPLQTGDWKVRLSWGGTVGSFDSITEEFPIRVTGVTLPLTSGQLDMISSPLIPVTPDPAITFGPTLPGTLTSVPVTTLNIVKWVPNGNQGQYLLLNTDGAFPGIAAANGYWMRPSQAVDLNPRGRLADQTQPYAIPLPVGWNMFGSVYLQDINWSAVQVRFNGVVRNITDAGDAIRPIAWGYNKATGGYEAISSSDVLHSGKGYWIRVLQPGVELILNPPGTRSASRAADIREGSIQLAATAGNRMDADTFIPLTGSYKSRIADLEKPPYLDNFISVRLLPSEAVTLPEATRAANPTASVIAFEVVTDQKNSDVTLQLRNGAALGRKYDLKLVDITAKQTRAMQSTSGFTFNTGDNAAPRRFALLVERETIVGRMRIDGLRVTGRSSGSYQFGYTITQDASVRVQIVGQDGKTVRDNVGGRAATRGANSLVWDLKDTRGISVPAGSYILKLTATKSDGEQVNHSLPVVVVR